MQHWPTFPMLHQYQWKYIAPISDNEGDIVPIGAIYAMLDNISNVAPISVKIYCANIGQHLLRQHWVFVVYVGQWRWYCANRGNICNVGQHFQCCTNIGRNTLPLYRLIFTAPTFRWLGGVAVRTSDSWSLINRLRCSQLAANDNTSYTGYCLTRL